MHKLLAHPEVPGVLFQQNHVGVYTSQDAGEGWTRIDGGLPSDFGFGLALHAQDPHGCFVFPLEHEQYSFRATGGEIAVYQYGRSGRWRKRARGLPRKHAHVSVLRQAMANDTLDACGVYFGTQGGTLFASNDAGASWAAIAEHLPSILSVTAAVVE